MYVEMEQAMNHRSFYRLVSFCCFNISSDAVNFSDSQREINVQCLTLKYRSHRSSIKARTSYLTTNLSRSRRKCTLKYIRNLTDIIIRS